MLKKAVLLLFVLVSFTGFSQFINKGDVKISNGTTVYISGVDFINDNGTTHTWFNDGQVTFKGDNFTNNGTMSDAASGSTTFSGVNEQNIKGTSIANFNDLIIDNSSNSVVQLEKDINTNFLVVNNGTKDFDFKVNADLPLTVGNRITLNGDLRLMEGAQLLQTHTGTSSVSGAAYIWQDQQGTSNQYYYNYWSAPVNQSGTWKMGYLKDGATGDNALKTSYPTVNIAINTNATSDVNNESGSHPVTLNAYWVFAFKNGDDGEYTGWYDNHIQHNGTVLPGEGYTMKGPGVDKNLAAANGSATVEYDSWTFSGLPNDGEYSLTIGADKDYLIGNPYPSALDANQFIHDNTDAGSVFNGTLYFWEHTGGNDHFGANYQGGYATYNLTGATAATAWNDSNTTVGTKTPEQFIPVGQGFTVWAESGQGGTIQFNNAQRVLKTEGSTSVFIRPANLTNIRLGFDTPQNYHRQLLLGIRPNTTSHIDVAWDGPNFDGDFPGADANWSIEDKDFIIQAVPQIDQNSRLPLHVKVNQDGWMSFNVDAVDNLPTQITNIYIEDTHNQISHPISQTTNYKVFLQPGDYNDRFVLTFKPTSITNVEEVILNNVTAYYDNAHRELVVLNTKQQEISNIKLYSLTGQEILSYDKKTSKSKILIPVNISTGVYLVRIASVDNRIFTKKLMVK